MRYRNFNLFSLLLAAVLAAFLAACSDGDNESNASPTAATATVEAATATARPSATPEPTATPSATPEPQAAVEAVAQSVDESGEVVASRVYAPVAGWLAVYADEGGEPGALLGHAALAQGEQRDVALTVDPYLVTPLLHFVLHADDGEEGAFEFPDGDEPLQVDGEPVATTAAIELLVAIPAISVADQELGEDSSVLVAQVSAARPGWVVVQADDGGEPGKVLGMTPLGAGETNDVVVRIDWRHATRPLHAVLYADDGEEGRFEPEGDDLPVTVSGQVVTAAFMVQGPPDIFAINQPVVSTEIVLERVFVNEAGWVLVFSNFEGFTDRLLGHARVEAGENLLVAVPVVPGNTTDVLHVQLHRDDGEAGLFEYPAGDPPLLGADGQPVRVSIETDMGNYLLTRDQPLGDGDTIVVPLVVSDLDTWVVVWTAPPDATDAALAGEEPGEIIGQTRVERGVRRDVVIEIDAAAAGETVYVVLHQDAGEPGQFDFPGADEILRRERAVILAPVGVGDGD